MNVTIYQCKPKGHIFPLFSWLIQVFQWINYSHYAIEYFDGSDIMVIDATAQGVREMRKDIWLKHYEVINSFTVELDCNSNLFRNWTNQHKGKSYGFLQILGLCLQLFKIIKTNPFGGNSKRIICNELVLIMLKYFSMKAMGDLGDLDNYDMVQTERVILKTEGYIL